MVPCQYIFREVYREIETFGFEVGIIRTLEYSKERFLFETMEE